MKTGILLTREFYNRPSLLVARNLLGARLIRVMDGVRLGGMIIETEAYIGEEDLGCHARAGKTKRNAVMYGKPGQAYIYFTYGMHWMLNSVTERQSFPAAVLIRAMEPLESIDIITSRRHGGNTFGPAKLTQALGIDGSLNGADLCSRKASLWIEKGVAIPDAEVITGPRVGLENVPEPWRSKPWRFQCSSRFSSHIG
jgi:DNA-3-methyladenine glycosylase